MPNRLPKNVFADSPLRSTVSGVPLAAQETAPASEAAPRTRQDKPTLAVAADTNDAADSEKVSVYVSKEIRDLVEDEVYRRRKAGSRITRQVVYREALEAWAKAQRRKS